MWVRVCERELVSMCFWSCECMSVWVCKYEYLMVSIWYVSVLIWVCVFVCENIYHIPQKAIYSCISAIQVMSFILAILPYKVLQTDVNSGCFTIAFMLYIS